MSLHGRICAGMRHSFSFAAAVILLLDFVVFLHYIRYLVPGTQVTQAEICHSLQVLL